MRVAAIERATMQDARVMKEKFESTNTLKSNKIFQR